MNNANAAFLGNGDGQARFCDGIHGRRNQGQIQSKFACELRGKGRVLGQNLRVGWHQQHIVESEGFTEQAHKGWLQKKDCTLVNVLESTTPKA